MKRSPIVVVVLALLVIPGGAHADREAPRRSKTVPTYGTWHRLATLKTPRLVYGQSVLVYGRMTARNGSRHWNAMQVARVQCGDEYGVQTTRNNEGGRLAIDVRHLFVAPWTGAFTCALWGRVGTTASRSPGRFNLTILSHGQTYLAVDSRAHTAALRWGLEHDCGSASCVIDLGPEKKRGRSATVLRSPVFVANPLAKQVEVLGDLQLTNCYYRNGSCVHYGTMGRRHATATTQLFAIQLDPLGRPCLPAAEWPHSRAYTGIVSRDAHHRKFSNALTVPISLAPGCTRQFTFNARALWRSGNPIRIENSRYSTGIAFSVMP